MLNTLRFAALIIILTCLCGCEYQLDKENYRDIKDPNANLQFDLNLVGEGDTIKIFAITEFTCDFNLDGHTFLSGEILLQGRNIGVYSEKGRFKINPQEFSPGYDTMTLILYTNTGDGSLADIVGAKAYKVIRKWLVLIDGRPAPILTLTNSITPEGYLKISWPKCEQYNFHSYTYYSHVVISGITKIITDADSNFYIDSCYIGGEAYYRVDSRMIDNNESGYGNQLQLNEPYPTLQFTEIGIDSVKIHWNKSKYKANYILFRQDISQDSAIFKSSTDTSFTMPSPGLGVSVYYKLNTTPFKANSSNTYYNKSNSSYYNLGTFFEGNWPDYGYNRMEKALYTSTYDDVHCYDIVSFTLQKSLNIYHLGYQNYYSCPTNSTKVAVLSPYDIYIFPDKNLENPVLIPYGSFGLSIDHFYITDNDIIAIAKSKTYEQIRISDKQVIATIDIDDYPYYSKWACITTSRNGKYACVVTKNGLKLYSIENSIVTVIYSDTRSYRSALFDENTEGNLLLTFYDNNTLEVRNAAGFSLVKAVDLPTIAEVLSNIDPATGYVLLTDYQNNYVMDLINSKPKLKVYSPEYKPRLYNNRLLTGDGCMLDIAKFLGK